MKSILVLILFLGMFMITHGIYEQKIKDAEKNKKIEYKFIPRSLYEEQMNNPAFNVTLGNMFDTDYADPWADINRINILPTS